MYTTYFEWKQAKNLWPMSAGCLPSLPDPGHRPTWAGALGTCLVQSLPLPELIWSSQTRRLGVVPLYTYIGARFRAAEKLSSPLEARTSSI